MPCQIDEELNCPQRFDGRYRYGSVRSEVTYKKLKRHRYGKRSPDPDMSSLDPQDQEFQERETLRREQELSLRLKEMEQEINGMSRDRSGDHALKQPSKKLSLMRRWRRNIVAGIQFFAVVVAVIVAIRVAFWLASIVMVLLVSYLIYEIFFHNRFDRLDDCDED